MSISTKRKFEKINSNENKNDLESQYEKKRLIKKSIKNIRLLII